MRPDDNSQQPSESAPAEVAPAPTAEVSAEPAIDSNVPLFDTPQLDVSLRESDEHEHRGTQ
jgi:hypothetical protein